MADSKLWDDVKTGVSRATGWSVDFSGDLLATVGVVIVAYWLGDNVPLVSLIPCSETIAASVAAAMYWKRARRDNG